MEKNTTEVSQWLIENDAAEFIDAFFDKGYCNLIDIDKIAIFECVPEDKSGWRRRLTNALNDVMEPELPPGTIIDLSLPILHDANGDPFELPEAVPPPPESHGVISAINIRPIDWMRIVRHCNALHGYDVSGPQIPMRADYAVLQWKVPGDDAFMTCEDLGADLGSALVYSARSSRYVREGFTKASATASYAGCEASFSYERKEKISRSTNHKSLHMVAWKHFPRVKLFLENCTTVSDKFLGALRKALAQPAEQQVTALKKVFEDYGHVISMDVVLGGRLYIEKNEEHDGYVEELEREETIKAAVSFKYGAASGGAEGETGSKETHQTEIQDIAKSAVFYPLGGDITLPPDDIPTWTESVKSPTLWQVIGRDETIATVDLLDDELRAKVLAVLPQVASHPWDCKTVSFISENLNFDKALSYGYAAIDIGKPGYEGRVWSHNLDMAQIVGLESNQAKGEKQKQQLIWRLEFYKTDTDGVPLFWLINTRNDMLLDFAVAGWTFSRPGHDRRYYESHPGFLVSDARKDAPETSAGKRCLWRIIALDEQNRRTDDTSLPHRCAIQNYSDGRYMTGQYFTYWSGVLGGHIVNMEDNRSPADAKTRWLISEE